MLGIAVLTASLLALGGCAGVTDPHPHSDELTNFKFTPMAKEGEPKFGGRLTAAIDVAEAQRQLYSEAAGNISLAKNAGMGTLVAMSATALYLGITSSGRAARDTITALGIAGAGLFGLGNSYISDERQRLYYQGAAAIGCAVASMSPYLMPKDQYDDFARELKAYAASRREVVADIAALDASVTELQTWLIPGGHAGQATLMKVVATGHQASVAANKAVAAVDKIYLAASELKTGIDSAHIVLISHVRNIVDAVDEEVRKTEPSFSSVQALLVGLPSLATQMVPPGVASTKLRAPSPEVPEGKKVSQGEQYLNNVVAKINALNADLAQLGTHANALRAPVQQFQSRTKTVETNISSCRPPVAQTQFVVLPDRDSVDVEAGRPFMFSVLSKTGIPSATIVGQAPTDVKLDVTVSNGNYAAVLSSGAKDKGTIEIMFADGARTQTKVVRVQLGPPTPAANGAAKTGQASVPAVGTTAIPTADVTALKALSKLQMMTLQAALKSKGIAPKTLTVDGIWGPETAKAVGTYRKDMKLGNDKGTWDQVAKDLAPKKGLDVQELVNTGKGKTKSQTPVEGKMTADDIKTLQQSQKIPPSGVFDVATREAIIKFQNANKLPVTGVILDFAILHQMEPKRP